MCSLTTFLHDFVCFKTLALSLPHTALVMAEAELEVFHHKLHLEGYTEQLTKMAVGDNSEYVKSGLDEDAIEKILAANEVTVYQDATDDSNANSGDSKGTYLEALKELLQKTRGASLGDHRMSTRTRSSSSGVRRKR